MGIPSFVALGTIPELMVLVPTYAVGTIFIIISKITIIRSIMIKQRVLSIFLIYITPFTIRVKGNST